ncbi:MAG: flagellar hook-basal body complex protein FliE [Verrucomicrobiota bacterium]|jgi:flagellar hook-basal body complex protein FliE
MDALSAIKMMAGTQMSSPLGGTAAQSGIVPSIAPQELEKLNSDLGPQSATAAAPSDSFQNVLGKFVGEVNAKQAAASDDMAGLLSGKNVSLHQAMISMEEASVSFQMMVAVRNKLLESYQEMMRMQV